MDFLHALVSSLVATGVALGMFVTNITDTYFPSNTVISIAPKVEAPPPPPQVYVAPSTNPAPSPEPATNSTNATASVVNSPATSTPPEPIQPLISAEALNTQTRDALVNILCTTQGGGVSPASGSGVFIDARGVVLTNAHVGQYFLLKDYPTKNDVLCTIRTGSPAKDTYHAKLLYLPPAWIVANASQIKTKGAKGTGENDYAFLLVTERSSGKGSLPENFPALPMTLQEPRLDNEVLLAAYPAGFLDGVSIQKNLYITTAYALVKKLFTYGTGREIDLVSIGGTVVSQGGSSGGATVRTYDGRLQGIIATASSADTTAGRDLRSVTIAHINRSLAKYDQGGLVEFLSQDLDQAAKKFESDTAPVERAALIEALRN